MTKTGGVARLIASEAYGFDIRIDDAFVYIGGGGSAVKSVHKNGDPGIVFTFDAFDFDIDETSLYGASLGGAISRIGKDGSALTQLAMGSASQGLSTRDGWAYWANYSGHSVARVPTSGGASETLAEAGDYTRSIVSDCHYAYFSVGNYGGQTWRVPLDGGAASLFADVGDSFAIDAASLYVLASDGAWRVSLATGIKTRLGNGSSVTGPLTGAITVDDGAVYWSTGDAVMRADK
ncbi:MAG: hypothetical protein ACHREM_06050 [Polyangiales bacterium]